MAGMRGVSAENVTRDPYKIRKRLITKELSL